MNTERKLPNPATTNDEFAYATVMELRRLNANLEELVATIKTATEPVFEGDEDGEVELRELALIDGSTKVDAPIALQGDEPATPSAKRAPKKQGEKASSFADFDQSVQSSVDSQATDEKPTQE